MSSSRNNVLEWDGELRLLDKLIPPIPREWVLIRVEYAYWGGLEEALRSGMYWPYKKPIILGLSGSGIVVELGVDARKKLSGEYVAPHILGSEIPGLTIDGYLAEYTSQPSSTLAVVPREEWAPLTLYASIACGSADIASAATSIYVYGLGLYGVLTLLLLSDRGYRLYYSTYKEKKVKRLLEDLGIDAQQVKLESTSPDVVIVSSLDTSGLRTIREDTKKIVVTPIHEQLSLYPRGISKTVIEVTRSGDIECVKKLLDDIWSTLSRYIGVVEGLQIPPSEGAPLLGYLFILGRKN